MHTQLKISQIPWTEKRGPAISSFSNDELLLKTVATGHFVDERMQPDARMERELSAERTVTMRTENLDQGLPSLAALVNVPLNRIAALPVANARPPELTFNRWAASDRTVLLAVYDQDCAKHMARHFPAEHPQLRSWLEHPRDGGIGDIGGPDWETYVSRTAQWAAGQAASNASDIGRSFNTQEMGLTAVS